MPKRKKPHFIQIMWTMYDSKEWRSLQWYSKIAYLRIKRKYNPNNGEKTSVSYREISDEMSQPTFGKAIKELLKVGFIEVVQKGGMFRKRNFYILSYRWKTLRASPLLKHSGYGRLHKAQPRCASDNPKTAKQHSHV